MDLILVALTFVMAAMSVWFWYLELCVFLDTKTTFWSAICHPILTVKAIMPLTVDLVITISATVFLGFGGGLAGGCVALFMSNIISLLIAKRSKIKIIWPWSREFRTA